MGPVTADDAGCCVTLQNDYKWIGDARLGRFAVFADRRKVGLVDVGGSLDLALPCGDHEIQVRLWRWYRSPSVRCTLTEDDHIVLRADIDRAISVPRRMAKMFVSPFRSLRLDVYEGPM